MTTSDAPAYLAAQAAGALPTDVPLAAPPLQQEKEQEQEQEQEKKQEERKAGEAPADARRPLADALEERAVTTSPSGLEGVKRRSSMATGAPGKSASTPAGPIVRKGRSPYQADAKKRSPFNRSRSSPAPPASASSLAQAVQRIPEAMLSATPSRSKSWVCSAANDNIGEEDGGLEEALQFLKRDQQQLTLVKEKKKERTGSPFEVFRKRKKAKKVAAESRMAGKCAVPVTLCDGTEWLVPVDTTDGGKSVTADALLRDTVLALQKQRVPSSPRSDGEDVENERRWDDYQLYYRLVEIGDLSKGALLNPLKLTKSGERIFLRDKVLRPQFVFKKESQREFNPFSELREKKEKKKDIEDAFAAWSKGKPKHRKATAPEAAAQGPQSNADIVVVGAWSVTAPQISTELGQELSKAGHKFYDIVKPQSKRDSFHAGSFTVGGKGRTPGGSEDASAAGTEDSSPDLSEEQSEKVSSAMKNTLKRKKQLVKRKPAAEVFPSKHAADDGDWDAAGPRRGSADDRAPVTFLSDAAGANSPVNSVGEAADEHSPPARSNSETADPLSSSSPVISRVDSRTRKLAARGASTGGITRVASDQSTSRLRSFLEEERESLRAATRMRHSHGDALEDDVGDTLLHTSAPLQAVSAPGSQAALKAASAALPISQILATSHVRASKQSSVFAALERKSSHDGNASSYDELAPGPPPSSSSRTRSKSALTTPAPAPSASGSLAVACLPVSLQVSIEQAAGVDARWEEADGRRTLAAGHPTHVLEHVLDSAAVDEEAPAFLATLRYFTDEEWFLQQLCARFRALAKKCEEGGGQQAAEMSLLDLLTLEYERDKHRSKMKRIVRVIELWTNISFFAFHRSPVLDALLNDLISFAESSVSGGAVLMENISRRAKPAFVGPVLDHAPMPLLPVGFVDGQPSPDGTSIMVFDPVEVARQLTLMDFRMVSRLTVHDLFDSAWQGPQKHEAAPNLVPYTERFNHVTFWVVTEILMSWNSHERVKKIEWFIRLTEELFVLRNFNSVMAVLSGVSMNVVERLKDTWRRVQPELHATLQTIAYVMQSIGNFKNYRAKLKSITPPFIPFQALICGDLTRACTGMPTYLEDGLVNAGKLYEIAKILRLVQVCQENPYGFYEVPVIAQHILSAKAIQDEDELYRLSTACEAPASGFLVDST